MKPFVVEMTIRTVVMAEDEDGAFTAGRTHFSEIARDEVPDLFVDGEVRSEADLPDGWDLRCIPYGGDGNTRLEALIDPQPIPTKGNGDTDKGEGHA